MKANYGERFIIGIVCAIAALSPRAAAAQSNPVPCSLLTQAQVSTAVGLSMGAGQPIATTGCSWSAGHVTATLSLWDATKWDKMRAPLPGMTKTPVGGMGDDAVFATVGDAGKQLITLTVKKGKTAFMFRIYGVEKASNQMSMEKTLAENVLAKL
jgi:hypothetical protein